MMEEKKKQNRLANLKEKIRRKRDSSVLNDQAVKSEQVDPEIKTEPADEETAPPRKKARRHRVRRKKNRTVPDGDVPEEFTILGEATERVKKVERRLPNWLADPTGITNERILLRESGIKLSNSLRKRMEKDGITHFFPVQLQVIPAVLNHARWVGFKPPDICVCAPTGSGKTLTYVLPLIQILQERESCTLRALVVVPVKDLALQVYNVFRKHKPFGRLEVVLLSGHSTVKEEAEKLVIQTSSGYRSGADIAVATPGRLVDHIYKTAGFSLNQLKYLVIDEADRMMTENNHDWLTEVERSVYGTTLPSTALSWNNMEKNLQFMPQKLLFSATLSQDAEILHTLKLFQPIMFSTQVEPDVKWLTRTDNKKKQQIMKRYNIPDTLKQHYIASQLSVRPLVLYHLIKDLGYKQVLCFTSTQESNHRLYLLMKEFMGTTVAEFSSEMPIKGRVNVVENFKQGNVQLLICTDLAARGIDIDNVEYVILYDAPSHIKNYIHRIGRTARAGRSGTAITFVQPNKVSMFQDLTAEGGIETASELPFSEDSVVQYGDMFKEALSRLKSVLKSERERLTRKIPGRRRTAKNNRPGVRRNR